MPSSRVTGLNATGLRAHPTMIDSTTLSSFPSTPVDTTGLVPIEGMLPIGMRACRDGDLAWLRTLYGEVRAGELARYGLPPLSADVVDSQFALQHNHYVTAYAGTDFFLVEYEGMPVGRFYFYRKPPLYLIVDISLRRFWQNRGIGSALLRATQYLARADNVGLTLHVAHDNPSARRLYQRLGFREAGHVGVHDLMHWDAVSAL
jgi:GNAT superfamily N-acetyltransferase